MSLNLYDNEIFIFQIDKAFAHHYETSVILVPFLCWFEL